METFNPVSLSLEENAWLLKHLGEPWIIAGRDIHPAPLVNPQRKDRNPIHYPDGVIPASVKPIIDKVYEYLELEKATGEKWVGVAEVKACINIYLAQAQKWQADKRRGRVRFPSMHSFTTKGKPLLGGTGSDSGSVKTYFDPKTGERKEFTIQFIPDNLDTWTPEWVDAIVAADDPAPSSGLNVDRANNRIECLICKHTENFKVDSHASYRAARARMSKHLRNDKTPELVEAHRQLHTEEFAS